MMLLATYEIGLRASTLDYATRDELVALDSLLRALKVQHPVLDASPAPNDPGVQRAVRDILLPLHSLRRRIRRYRRVAERLARDLQRDDLPF